MADSIFPQGSGYSLGKKILADFSKASAVITSACASASGWDAQVHNAAAAAAASVLMYVWDSATGWVWVCSVPSERFTAESQRASRARPEVVQAIRSDLGNTIYRVATGLATEPTDEGQWENLLGMLLAAYAGTTQVWQVTKGLHDGGHFVVLFYREKGREHGNLRPFALPRAATGRDVLPVEWLRGAIREVEKMDRARHPEWFQLHS